MDTRTTSADFYPGGKTPVTAGGGITSGEGEAYNGEQRVPITSIEGLPERFTEGDMKSKIDDICKVLRTGGLALAAILSFPAWGADGITVHGTRKDRIYNDGFVVTNVTADLKVLTTNDVCNIVTNEVSSGWSDWSYTPEIEYFENEEIVSIVPMEWVESGDDPECRFPCWKLQAVTRVQNEVGEVREFESVYYSGYYWKSQGYDDAIVVLATDIACDTRIKATRKPLAKNALGLAMAKDVPTAEAVTNVARSVVNSVWDASLGVAWEARMHNGHLYYIAVTNKPPEVK